MCVCYVLYVSAQTPISAQQHSKLLKKLKAAAPSEFSVLVSIYCRCTDAQVSLPLCMCCVCVWDLFAVV